MKSTTNHFVLKYSELAMRIYVFFMMNVYGLGKILNGQFFRAGNIPEEVAKKTIVDLSGFELAWTFFGHSTFYIYFIGISQMLGAFLLLSDKLKLLGILILVPVLLNIIVVDACFGVSWGAMMSASLYLLLLLLVLIINKERVLKILQAFIKTEVKDKTDISKKAFGAVVILIVMALVFVTEQFLLHRLGR